MSASDSDIPVELTRAQSLSPRVRGLRLRTLGSPISWHPGQYLEVSLDGVSPPAAYSIASAPSAVQPGEFELAISRSASAPDLAVGSVLRARGPFGALLRKEPRQAPLILVATGTGLAPLRALIQDEFASGGSRPVTLLFGCRNEAEILWRHELEALSAAESRFRFEPSLSRAENGWSGRRGYVQLHLSELLDAARGAEVYLCGLSEMVRDCRALLESRGQPRDLVIGEAF
jgi:phenol hydroxylase P5 protein